MDLPLGDVQRDVVEADDMAGFGLQFGFRHAAAQGGERLLRGGAEDLGYTLDMDGAFCWGRGHARASESPIRACSCLPKAWVMRSKTIASTTMPSPANRPRLTSRRPMPCSTW